MIMNEVLDFNTEKVLLRTKNKNRLTSFVEGKIKQGKRLGLKLYLDDRYVDAMEINIQYIDRKPHLVRFEQY